MFIVTSEKLYLTRFGSKEFNRVQLYVKSMEYQCNEIEKCSTEFMLNNFVLD